MERQIHIEMPKEELDKLYTGDKPFLEIKGEYIFQEGFTIQPFEGYEKTPNYPNCCEGHITMVRNLNDWFTRFPYCCDKHKKLIEKKWFRKEIFKDVVDKIVNQLSLTNNYILSNLDSKSWKKDIEEYLHYSLDSFGTPPIGAEQYYRFLENWIKNYSGHNKLLTKEKRKVLLQFLKSLEKTNEQETDLNILYSTFQKWLKTFPDLDFFIKIKESYNNKMPFDLLLYDENKSQFDNISRFKIRTENEFIDILINITKDVLSKIDTVALVENKKITDTSRFHLDVLNEEHRMKQKRLSNNYSAGEVKYVKILKKWLQNEKEYFQSLKILFQDSTKNIEININGNNNAINNGDNSQVNNIT